MDDAPETDGDASMADTDSDTATNDPHHTESTRTGAVRTATVRTDHATAARATRVARAVSPDNTASMTTHVDDASVETDIARETTGGLQATVDDYLVNLGIATAVLDSCGTQHSQPTTTTNTTHHYE